MEKLWLKALMEAMDPGAFVRIRVSPWEKGSVGEVIFDGEAGEFRPETVARFFTRPYEAAAVKKIWVTADPDTVDNVMEIFLEKD